MRRTFLKAGVACSVQFMLGRTYAQAVSGKPVEWVVGFAAGGGSDAVARSVAEAWAKPIHRNIVVINKPGAGTNIAAEYAARSRDYGNLVFTADFATLAANPHLFPKLAYNAEQDFVPIGLLARFPLLLVVHNELPVRSFQDFAAWAKANPGKLNIGTPQIGTTQNLAAEMFKLTAGIDAQVVPFNGTPPVVTAVRGGEIDAMVDILGPLVTQISGKTLRALAVLGKDRAPQLPDVPAARETGPAFAQMNLSSWNGLAAPAKTPPAVVERLSKEIQTALAKPELVQRLRELNLTARSSTPQQARDFLAADVQRWSDVIAKAKIQKL